MKPHAFPLAFLALLVALCATASATHGETVSDVVLAHDDENIDLVQASTGGAQSSCTGTDNVDVSARTTDYWSFAGRMIASASNTGTLIVEQSTNGTDIVSVTKLGELSQFDSSVGAVILEHVNYSSSEFHAKVAFVMPDWATSVRMRCTATAGTFNWIGNIWSPVRVSPDGTESTPGLNYLTATNIVGLLIELPDTSLPGESAILSQIDLGSPTDFYLPDGAPEGTYTFTTTTRNPGGVYHAFIMEQCATTGCAFSTNNWQVTGSGGIRNHGTVFVTDTINVYLVSFESLSIPYEDAEEITFTLEATNTMPAEITLSIARLNNQSSFPNPYVYEDASTDGPDDMYAYVFHGEDEYSADVVLTVEECSDSTCATMNGTSITHGTYSYVVTTPFGTRTVSSQAWTGGTFTISGRDLAGGGYDSTVAITLVNTSYTETRWTLSDLQVGDNAFTIGMKPRGSAGSASISSVEVLFSGNVSRVVPDVVTITVERTASETVYLDIAYFDGNGGSRSVATAIEWSDSMSDETTLSYPEGIEESATRHVGRYWAYATDSTGAYLNGTAFCIGSSWSNCSETEPSLSTLQRLSTESLQEVIAIQSQADLAADLSQEQTVKRYYASFLEFVFTDEDFGIPNFVVFLLFCLTVLMAGIGARYRRG